MNQLKVRAELSVEIAKIIDENKDKPSWYIAEKIIQMCLMDELDKVKAHYERLFFTDLSNKH